MILCDTGPIVSSINPRDPYRARCLAALAQARDPLITTWPCLTEAMYLVGLQGQEQLRRQLEAGVYTIAPLAPSDVLRACSLMRRYADAPMDFADASLVVAAEILAVRKILTFDAHFYAYRIHDRFTFEVLP